MMPRFNFRAYDQAGRVQSGEVEADSREVALQRLVERGHLVLDLHAGTQPSTLPWWQRDLTGSRQLPLTGLATLARELATLTKADVPIDECLRLIAGQPQLGRRARNLVASILEQILQGAALSEALAAQNGAVPEYFWRLVKAGEVSGALPKVLDELASLIEASARVRAQVVSTLLYPMVLLVAAGVAIAVIVTVMVPAILPLFQENGIQPPFLIRTLAAIEQAVVGYWPLWLAGIIAVGIGLIAVARNAGAATLRDRLFLRLPMAGGLIERRNTARFARNLGTMTGNGVPLLEALRITIDLLANRAWRAAMRPVETEINQGGTMAEPLARTGLFPDLAIRLIAIGEKSGQLESMLRRVADIYEHDLHVRLQRVLDLLAPLLTLLIGVLIGGLILSVMGAILSVNELVTR
jgi:general secretion pathway protein F